MMRRSLRGVLSRVEQLAERARAAAPSVDVAAILIGGRRREHQRHRMFAERGYGETAAERYASHLERKPRVSVADAPWRQAWFWKRQADVWTRLQPEYAAEAAREAAGYPPAQDPAWWSKSDAALRAEAGGTGMPDCVVAGIVADRLSEMRRERIALLQARREGGQ